MYLPKTLSSGWEVPPKGSERTRQTSMFYSYLVLLIYVTETIYLLGNLSFFKIHVNHFMAWDDSPAANVAGEGPGAIL